MSYKHGDKITREDGDWYYFSPSVDVVVKGERFRILVWDEHKCALTNRSLVRDGFEYFSRGAYKVQLNCVWKYMALSREDFDKYNLHKDPAETPATTAPSPKHSGDKYHVEISDVLGRKCHVYNKATGSWEIAKVDHYAIASALQLNGGAVEHAHKKMSYAGKRGKGDRLQDLKEARDAITREINALESQMDAEQ